MSYLHKSKYTMPLLIMLVSFGYYITLCAKEWTWVFVSFDSTDWLASSYMWMTPQPFGSPLYILMGHLLNLFPGDLALKMTIVLSVIPASVTVGIVYIIIKELGYNNKMATLGSCILLSCAIFLSQATVLEEYAISAMFVTIAFLFYVRGNKKLVMLFLALGTAVHIIVGTIAALWLVVELKEWRRWRVPAIAIYTPIVVGFYCVILYLMWADTPKVIAGNLSLSSINAYLGTTGTIGKISLIDTPGRLWEASRILLVAFGITLIPLVYGLLKPHSKVLKVIVVTTVFCLWLYITNVDMTTWTFMSFGIPIAVVAIIIGLSKMPKWCTTAVIISSLALIMTNSVMLNADLLTDERSEAKIYYAAMNEIPDDSAVVLPKGGAYGMGLMYAMSRGRDLTPIFMQKQEGWTNRAYLDYLDWINDRDNITGNNWIEQVQCCLEIDKNVYVGYIFQPDEWKYEIDAFFGTEHYNEYFRKVTHNKNTSDNIPI